MIITDQEPPADTAEKRSLADRIRVLYVDDPGRLEETRERLEQERDVFEVTTERRPGAGLERIEEGQGFDCIVSGYDLPELDGLDFLHAVREYHADLPFVLVAGENVASEALAAGVTDYLQRGQPDQYALLANQIRNAVDQWRAKQVARQTTKAVDIVDEPMAFFDGECELVYANEAYCDLFCETPEEVLGAPLAARFAPAERDRFEAEIYPETSETGRWAGEARGRATTGEEFPAEHRVYRLTDGGYLHQATDISRRESREERLASFQQAIEHAGHVVMLTGTDGTIEYVNPAFEETTGYTTDEALGETPAILNSGEHDEAFYDDLWDTITGGDVWEGELVNERKDGERYHIDQTIAPVEDDDGERIGFVAVNTDVTDRKEHERELAFFEQAIEQVGTGMAAYDASGAIHYANEHYAQLLGTTCEDLVGSYVWEVNPLLEADQFDDYWESFDPGETRVYETVHERLDDGETFPVETVTTQVRIHGTDYHIGTISDITERKERERSLRTFRKAIEHAGHTVMLTDTDGTIEYVNPAFEETTGYTSEEAIGETPAILNSGEHDEEFYDDLWDTITGGDVWEGEVVNESRDGERYHIDQTIAPIHDDDGELERFVAINTNITSLKEHEAELERQNERLERYGRTVAHDLRNPLNVLESRIEYLESQQETCFEDHSDVMCESLDKMKTLIDELLTLAKHGQTVLEPATASLEDAAAAAWQQTETADATLDVEAPMHLLADETRLEELFGNLFRNAIEHAGDGASVRIGLLSDADGFFVADDGPGIPHEERERVLDLGYTTASDGTGFGLAIVNEIAEAHGWDVHITDSESDGARFEVSNVERVGAGAGPSWRCD